MTALGFIADTILSRAPKYLRGPNIGRFLQAAGLVMDGITQATAEGFKLSNPLHCDPSAFPSLSKDRKIRLYANEPEESKRYRLSIWHQIRRHEASCYGSMINVQPFFLPGALPNIYCVHQDGNSDSASWHRLDPSGVYTVHVATPTNFFYDGHPEKWSRWWVFIDMAGTGFSPPNVYDDGHIYDDGARYDEGDGIPLTAAFQADIVQCLVDSNPPHAWLGGVILVWPGAATFDPTGSPLQNAAGWWNLPNGANTWELTYDPTTGLGTRPPNFIWILDNPAP